MKNAREYYTQCLKSEIPTFVKVMKAVPPDQADYKPHPRSTSSGALLWLLATELDDACTLIERGEVNYVERPGPGIAASIAAYQKHAAALEAQLATLDDAKWDGKARLMMNGQILWEAALGDMLFGFLLDAIHHRGQLSSYLRPMGAKVPSIYGPSADEPGQA
ncbi:MAG TPA: DinB family protein [Vicinamibacterales bacterium]